MADKAKSAPRKTESKRIISPVNDVTEQRLLDEFVEGKRKTDALQVRLAQAYRYAIECYAKELSAQGPKIGVSNVGEIAIQKFVIEHKLLEKYPLKKGV
jgi:hypothetical protein